MAQGSRIVGQGVREFIVYSACTVLMVSFGGLHFLRMLYSLIKYVLLKMPI